ncbi:hypothetical protein [Calycomorphotria hydatis]|uniref:Uncharacterized protein n=1 Tax=Calycomorphotria hydatis TaxID=2528027 RepID=A0A517T8R1_9PLAN|nr:hypothetical protein [Calycomorphotria hydatis]QDT64771.1 hypothetical protein V22_20120 [Calycomorphotria hydatis]
MNDSPKAIKQGQKRMRFAWEEGHRILETVGLRASYRDMMTVSGENASKAEQMRKYRAMANRIPETELGTIGKLCIQHGKAWGPTHLVTLSRLTRSAERRALAKTAIRERWGHTELKRQIRRMLGPVSNERHRGRKRMLDVNDQEQVLDQIRGLVRAGYVWLDSYSR